MVMIKTRPILWRPDFCSVEHSEMINEVFKRLKRKLLHYQKNHSIARENENYMVDNLINEQVMGQLCEIFDGTCILAQLMKNKLELWICSQSQQWNTQCVLNEKQNSINSRVNEWNGNRREAREGDVPRE